MLEGALHADAAIEANHEAINAWVRTAGHFETVSTLNDSCANRYSLTGCYPPMFAGIARIPTQKAVGHRAIRALSHSSRIDR